MMYAMGWGIDCEEFKTFKGYSNNFNHINNGYNFKLCFYNHKSDKYSDP